MYDLNSKASIVIQVCMVIIALGVFFNLRSQTKIYGGLIGSAIRLFGMGTVFFTLSVMERVLVDIGVVQNSLQLALAQDILNILGLSMLGLGFSKLVSAGKA